MKKSIVYLLAIMGLIVTTGCLKDPNVIENLDTIEFLTSEQLTELYTGNTISGKHLKFQKHFIINYKTDGTYVGTIADGMKDVSGVWKVKDGGKICGGKNTEDRCWKVYSKQENFHVVRDGKRITTFTVKKE